MLRIDKRLHLVVPIYVDEEGSEVSAYVHSTPIGEEIIDRYFLTLGQTYAAIFSQGLGIAGGPAHAMRLLRHIATQREVWHDDPKTGAVGIEHGLVDEMRRLTMVAARVKEGDAPCPACAGKPQPDPACPQCAGTGAVPRYRWQSLPLDVAVQQGVISSEDKTEVENAIVFFTVTYATLNRSQRTILLREAAALWGAQISSSPFTEFSSSLRTSTGIASSGERSPAPASGEPDSANATVAGRPRSVPV